MYNVIFNSYRRSVWHYNVSCHRSCVWHHCNVRMFNVTGILRATARCHRSCVWHCNTLMYNVLRGSAIHNVTQIQCDSGQICFVPPFWCDNDAIVEKRERVIANNKYFDRLHNVWQKVHNIIFWDSTTYSQYTNKSRYMMKSTEHNQTFPRSFS